MGLDVNAQRFADYQAMADQLASIQAKAGSDQSVVREDVDKLRQAVNAFRDEIEKLPEGDGIKEQQLQRLQKIETSIGSLDAIVEESRPDGSNNMRWEQEMASMDDLLRSVYPEAVDAEEGSSAALHNDFVSTVLGKIPMDKSLTAADLNGLKDFVSAHQGNLSSEWVAKANDLMARATSSDSSQALRWNDVSALGAIGIGTSTQKGAASIGSTVTLLSEEQKATLPGGLAKDTNAVVKLDGNPPSYIEESGPNYTLFNAEGVGIGQFPKTQNAVIGLNNGSWLQLAPTGLAHSTQLPDVSKIPNPSLSAAYTLKGDGTGVNNLGTVENVVRSAGGQSVVDAMKGGLGGAAAKLMGSGSPTGTEDKVTPGDASFKDDPPVPYTWVTVADGSPERTYVNFSKGFDESGKTSELWVNQGPNHPVDYAGLDPSVKGPKGDGAFFLPDGSVAIKAADKGYVISGGVVTDIEAGTKVEESQFFADNPSAKPVSTQSGFAFIDNTGQPNAAQLKAMEGYGVNIEGYGAGSISMPSKVFDAALRNVEGSRHWMGVGDGTNGQSYIQFDKSTQQLFASATSKVDTGYEVVGKNPDNKTDAGALFLADGSVAFKYKGDGYVESGGTVVSISDPARRATAEEFFKDNPDAKPSSGSSAISNPKKDGMPTVAQAATLSRYDVQIEGIKTSASGATQFVTEPLQKNASVPGGGVVTLKPGDANYAEMGKWPAVQKVLKDNESTKAPVVKKAQEYQGGEALNVTDEYAEGTLENEGWQVFSIPGAKTAIIYDPADHTNTPMHAFDTTTGQEVALPMFLTKDNPSGSVIFADGTRMDIKAKPSGENAHDASQSGITIASGDQLTTSDSRVASGASYDKPVQIQDAAAVKSYLAGTRLHPNNTTVQIGAAGATQFAYSNNVTPGGGQAWGLAGDGNFGGESQPALNWLNDPNSTENEAITRALFPDEGFAPEDAKAGSDWQQYQIGEPPRTKEQFTKEQTEALASVFTGLPGVGAGIWALGKLVQLGKAGLRGSQPAARGAPAVRQPSSPRHQPANPLNPAAGEKVIAKSVDDIASAVQKASPKPAPRVLPARGQDTKPISDSASYAESFIAKKTEDLATAANPTERLAAMRSFTQEDVSLLRRLIDEAGDNPAKDQALRRWTKELVGKDAQGRDRDLSDFSSDLIDNQQAYGATGDVFADLIRALKGKGKA